MGGRPNKEESRLRGKREQEEAKEEKTKTRRPQGPELIRADVA